jgi:hypothetical protein
MVRFYALYNACHDSCEPLKSHGVDWSISTSIAACYESSFGSDKPLRLGSVIVENYTAFLSVVVLQNQIDF